MRVVRILAIVLVSAVSISGCGSPPTGRTPDAGAGSLDAGGSPDAATSPAPSCTASGGSTTVAAPAMLFPLADRFHEGWLSSPSVADLDGDGTREIVLGRADRLLVFDRTGAPRWQANVAGRIWASPVVADFTGDGRLEVVVAARSNVHMFDAAGAPVPGFPVAWRDELRSLAAGDVDGDGRLEIVVATTSLLRAGVLSDVFQIIRGDGRTQQGFPANTSGTSGCGPTCYLAGAYDQNLAVGPLDGDGNWDIVVPHDNAYISWHKGSGVAFDSAAIFRGRPKVPGIRFLHDYTLAQQGYSDDDAANQAHFTNSAPAITDLDGDGRNEIVVLGSVQNVAQDDRHRGVALWVVNPDGTRPPAWTEPLHVPGYLAGLVDFDGQNITAATNQVAVADLDPTRPGPELLFAGFDGQIHAVSAQRRELWAMRYTAESNVLTGGVAIADLSGDGRPELVFATYSTAPGSGQLIVADAGGTILHRLALPGRGSMAVPTLADVDGNGTLEVVVNLKDGEDRKWSGLVFTVPGSTTGCRLWPTGRGNDLRNGFVGR
jgi:hypothetical protein